MSDQRSTDQGDDQAGGQRSENANGRANGPDTSPREDGELLGTPDPTDGTLQKDPEDWVSGDDPATDAQKSYLDTLAKEAGEQIPAQLSKREASEQIDRLRKGLGRLD